MANIMLLTVMPTELMADVLYSENAAVSVSWKPRENQVLFGGKGIIDLSVGVDTEKIQSAQVKISLTEKEAESFTQFEEINGVKTFSENGRTWKIVQDDDDSDKYLLTTDDIDSNISQSFELSYSPADDTEESFDIDVTKEDVDVQYTAKETVNDTPAVVLPAIDEKKPVVDVPQEGEITEPDKSTDASKNEETLPDSSEATDENNDGNGETIEETPSADETTPSESTETTDETTPSESTETTDETESTEESGSSEPSDEISASEEESQVTEAGNEIETQEIEYSDDVDESFGVDADEETAPIEISIDTEKLTFVKEMQKKPVVQSTVVAAADENVNWIKGSTNGNILFTASIPDSKKEQSFEFDFTNLKINSDITLDGNTIMCGENKLVSLEGLKDTMRIDALKSSDNKVSFKIIDDSESQTEENTEITFTVYSNTLSADENAETAKIVLTAGDSQAVTDITLEELKTADTTGRVSLNETIFWVDNNNEEHIRPSSVAQPVLKYRIDDGEEVVLDENTADLAHKLAAVGLKAIPTVSYSSNGSSSGNTTVKCDNLPEKIISLGEDGEIIQQKINWYWQQPDVDGYTKETVDESNKDSLNAPSIGWYYVLNRSFTMTTTVRDGYVGLIKNYFDETANKFSLYVSGTDKVIKLKEWKNVVRSEIVDGKFTTTVNDIPKYSLNGESLTYYMKLSANENTDENGVPYFSFADMETGDRIEVKYDNSSTHGFSNYEDAVYSGGEMFLTLAGEVDFEAHKIWSDTEEDVRPSGRLTLWRYRTEEGYNTAAPAYNSVGTQYSIYFGNGSYPEKIAFTDVNGEKAVFPKYDALGHHYLYVVREEFDNGDSKGYEQLFGAYNEETKTYTDRVPSSEKEEPSESITENGKRADRANTYLYNNGTLYNKKIDNINAVVTKKWDAVSFQEEFKNIEVTVELQRRRKGSADEWEKIKSATLTGFSIVNLSKTASAVVPKRDADKNELEYRWVETGIRQNGTDIDFNSNGNGGIFVLTQGGRDIDYVSKASTVQSTNGDYNTTIINSTRDTVTYDVIKKWNGVPADGTELKFNIYQSTTGLNNTGSMTPYISFKMTKDGAEKTGGSERAEISTVEKAEGEWNHIRISNLPEFDLKGRQYEYIIDEEGVYGQSYSTKKIAPENINYETTVTNKVSPSAGLEKQILVEKKWVDDSDIIHRLPVNISVYDKNNKVIKNITLGEGNLWNQWVNIGQNDPDEVYILETSLGENGEHKVSELDGSEQVVTQPSYEGDSITEEEVSTDHHRYQVRYGKTDLNGNKLYIVSNNRLGNINIDARKTWNDGDGHLRTQMKAVIDAYNQTAENPVALAMWLDFKSPKDIYKITHTDGADVANIGGDDVEIFGGADGVTDKTTTKSAVQPINIEADSENHSNRTQNFVFYNLPKYDINGEIVGYSVTEQWVVKTGNTYQKISSDLFNSISAEIDGKTVKLADIWAEYANTSSESYTVALDTEEASEVNLNDRQFIGIQNYRSETKNVTWHKIWQDEYSYNNGTRPDIHLLILSRNRNSDGSFLPTSKFVAHYSWK